MKYFMKYLGYYVISLILLIFICSLLNLVGVNSTITNLILFIFNATLFFGKKEMMYIYEQAKYKKYQLLLLDAQNVEVNQTEENKLFIDKDCCIIDSSLQ